MTANRRIFLNIVATYGRSLYALVCGLFISRWVLAAEKSEFGVCGVVGGMMVIEFLAGTMRRDRISPEAVGRAARFACRVAIRLPDEQREEPCAARSQEVERALAGCGIVAVEDECEASIYSKHIRKGLTLFNLGTLSALRTAGSFGAHENMKWCAAKQQMVRTISPDCAH